MLDVNSIRKDYPIFEFRKPLVYLDNAATTQKPSQVINTISKYYETINSNVHRGVYRLAADATEAYESARKSVAKFLNTSDSNIVFTRGTTESINLVAHSYLLPILKEGDEVLITGMEHHSNLLPWQWTCNSRGADLKVLPITKEGLLDLDQLESLLSEKTKMLALVHISNTLGTINPIKELIKKAGNLNIPVLIDGAQAAANQKVDVIDLDCDFYAFSSHKMYGPMGVGVLYAKQDLLTRMDPFNLGGEMIKSVTFNKTIYKDPPHKFEAGTPNVAGAIGLESAINYLSNFGWDEIQNNKKSLLEYLIDNLLNINGLKIIGNTESNIGIVSFTVDNIHPHDLATLLDKDSICIRAGHHCTQPIMDFFGIPGTARVSLGIYNTKEEIDQLATSLEKAQKVFS